MKWPMSRKANQITELIDSVLLEEPDAAVEFLRSMSGLSSADIDNLGGHYAELADHWKRATADRVLTALVGLFERLPSEDEVSVSPLRHSIDSAQGAQKEDEEPEIEQRRRITLVVGSNDAPLHMDLASHLQHAGEVHLVDVGAETPSVASQPEADRARIRVVGVGGGGGNAVNTMIRSGMSCVDFIAANTDAQALAANLATVKIQLGAAITKGLGAGASPAVGRDAAVEDTETLREQLAGADMVFVTAGMGGGTGTSGAPVIAQVARDLGALTVGVVTKPFLFEGKRRMRQANDGIQALKKAVDTLITIPNQRLLSVFERNMPIMETFKRADDVLLQAVRGISDLVTVHGLINLDFADVRTIMSEMGMAMMGAAVASGENRAVEAARRAISSPLLDDISFQGARGVLINITGGPDLSLHEVNEAATLIQEEAAEDANIIFGAAIDDSMGDQLRISVIATGFGEEGGAAAHPPLESGSPHHRSEFWRGATPTASAPVSRAQASPRRVVKMGLIVDDAENPVWGRRQRSEQPDEAAPARDSSVVEDESAYDTRPSCEKT